MSKESLFSLSTPKPGNLLPNYMLSAVLSLFVIIALSSANAESSLIVLAAPEKRGYYSSVYDVVIDFHIRYAKSILKGRDSVLILTDDDSYPLYEEALGSNVLVNNAPQADIWMRDFTTVNPTNPVQFRYAPAAQGGDAAGARYVQRIFNRRVLNELYSPSGSWYLQRSRLILDGGNFVDNHVNRVIVSEKILSDNNMDPLNEADRLWVKEHIKYLVETITEVAIIPYDDPNLGHADGMVMWVDENTLFVNNMSATPDLRKLVLDELRASFPTVTIVEVPNGYKNGTEFDKKFSSAVGININTVVTDGYLYVPVFNNSDTDKVFLEILSEHAKKSGKTIVPIEASEIARMGGSCRCLAWQVSGEFADDVFDYFNEIEILTSTANETNTTSGGGGSGTDFGMIAAIVLGAGSMIAGVGVFGFCLALRKRRANSFHPPAMGSAVPDSTPVRSPGDIEQPIKQEYPSYSN
eukprot:TRINITY_DN3790_c3_g1_i1.p1 TRINITY_DN3790_c3_g1~~TRINITY_DN3790_c3_g1_i1.p1  ORF type:complete len:467 (+),score=96.07 TRINITY_DN3790_c3_g1_i1:60-1460(+)